MNRKLMSVIVVLGLIIVLGAWLTWKKQRGSQPIVADSSSPTPSDSPTSSTSPAPTATPTVQAVATTTPAAVISDPIAEFSSRITKKKFGTYVSPSNSPVSPEKFTGYHTGVDVEYGDVESEVPVYAVASGQVITSRTATGYGGVVAIRHTLNGKSVVTVYGHLAPSSLIANGSIVKAGGKIGILGKANSSETDGERKHLHFGIVKGGEANIKGYVSSQDELSGWYNPLDFHP